MTLALLLLAQVSDWGYCRQVYPQPRPSAEVLAQNAQQTRQRREAKQAEITLAIYARALQRRQDRLHPSSCSSSRASSGYQYR